MSEYQLPPLPVSVVVICWNSRSHIEGLRFGLSRQAEGRPAEYIVIDNGSEDDAVNVLMRDSPFPWRCLSFSRNTGFAFAANEGIRHSTYPYILLLNSDVILADSYVRRLLSVLETVPRAGAVQGLLLRQGGQSIDSAGISFDPFRRLPLDYLSGLSRERMPISKQARPFLINACNAAAVLLRRDMCLSMEREGQYFDEGFISYFEDADFFHRATRLGWQCYCEPRAVAEHVRGGSGGLARPSIHKRSWLNRFRFYLKNESALKRYLFRPWSLPLEGYRLIIKPLFDKNLRGSAGQLLRELPDIHRWSKIETNYRAVTLSPVIGSARCSIVGDNEKTGNSGDKSCLSASDGPIAVIIINYNTRDLLGHCLKTLAGPVAFQYPVIVVDNASPDGSAAMVEKEFPVVHLIASKENRGFARAVNHALSTIQADTYLILNADTEVSPDFPGLIAERLVTSPGVGILGPLILNQDRSIQLSWGRTPSILTEYRQRKLHQLYRQAMSKANSDVGRTVAALYGRDRSVDWVTGACLAIRRDTLRDIGPMDERFSLYFEDIDWCHRAVKAGWTVLFSPTLSIIHTGGAAAETCPEHAARQYRKSQWYFYRKHSSLFQQVLLWSFLHIGLRNNRYIGKFQKVPRAF